MNKPSHSYTTQLVRTGITAVVLSLLVTTVASAQTTTIVPTSSTAPAKPAVGAAAQGNIQGLQQKADREIDRRVTMLQDLTKRLDLTKKLTAEQKATLSAQIKTQIDNLQTLKTKIDADTDITTLRSDVQTLKTSHNVFQFFAIQIQLVASADTVLSITEKFTAFLTTLQQKAQSSGTITPATQTTITSIQAKIADAQKQAQDTTTIVLGLSPDGFPANRISLQKARTMLQAARLDITSARQLVGTLVQSLAQTSPAPVSTGTVMPSAAITPSGTPSVSPSASPSPSSTP